MLLAYMIDSPLYSLPSQSPKWEPPRLVEEFGFGSNRMPWKEWLGQAIPREIQQCGNAQSRRDAVWKTALSIEPQIPRARTSFYREQVLAMISINRESNRILYLIARAIEDAEKKDKLQAHQEVNQALASFQKIERAEQDAEYGKWTNWYRGDWLTGIYRTCELLQIFSKFLDDPQTHTPPLYVGRMGSLLPHHALRGRSLGRCEISKGWEDYVSDSHSLTISRLQTSIESAVNYRIGTGVPDRATALSASPLAAALMYAGLTPNPCPTSIVAVLREEGVASAAPH